MGTLTVNDYLMHTNIVVTPLKSKITLSISD